MTDSTVTPEPPASLTVQLVLPAEVTLEYGSSIQVESAVFNLDNAITVTTVTVESQALAILVPALSMVAVASQGPEGAQGLTGLKGDRGPTGATGAPGESGGLGLMAIAGEDMGGHRAFILNASGETLYAEYNNSLHFGRVAGVTLNAAAKGDLISCVRSGLVIEPSWSWVPNYPVYLSRSGLLTQIPPSTGFSQVLGMAVSGTALFVSPREPLFVS